MLRWGKHLLILLTAISMMLNLTVSPVLGEQYSTAASSPDPVWEEDDAETPAEVPEESSCVEAEQQEPGVRNEEPSVPEDSDDDWAAPEDSDDKWVAPEDPGQEQPAPYVSEEELFASEISEEEAVEVTPKAGGQEQQVPESGDAGTESSDVKEDRSLSYARDEERYARYYEELREFDAPSPNEGGQEAEEELVGAGAPSSYITPRLTPVRDQGTSGLCWAFSAAAILEASLLQRYTDENKNTLDLSEEQLAYFYFNRQNDPLQNTGDMRMIYQESDEPTAYRYASGSPIYLLQELSTGQGIAKEADVPFYLKRYVDSRGNVYYSESSAVPSKSKAYLSYAGIDSYETFDYNVNKEKKPVIRLIPLQSSSSAAQGENDYRPSPAEKEESEHIMNLIQTDTGFRIPFK